MASGKRSEVISWDKGDTDCDVGLGLNLQFHQHQQSGFVRKMITGQGGGLTFTADQREELERQTTIYKYMMASMAVPPQLLLPLSTTRHGGGRGGAAGDPEPWRCRRTDGKKWRCSRDVAPDHKYCERHSHKSRHSCRSRKPVEPHLSPAPATATSACSSMEFIDSPHLQYNLLPTPSYRYPHEGLMKKDAMTASPVCQQRGSMGAVETSLHEDLTRSIPFIDAWSLAEANPSYSICTATTAATIGHPTPINAHSSHSPIHSIFPLTLSVSSGIHIHDQPNISDATVTDHDSQVGAMRAPSSSSQSLNWMTSWIDSPSGGPLAEALCLGVSEHGSYSVRNNLEELVPSPLPYGGSSTSSTSSKDTGEQVFRLS